VERFKSGRTRVTDEGRSGRPLNIAQPKSFLSAGIRKPIERYNKRIVLQGDYVEK